MTKKQHKKEHEGMNKALGMIVKNYMDHTDRLPSEVSVFELMDWAYVESLTPTESEVKFKGGVKDEIKAIG